MELHLRRGEQEEFIPTILELYDQLAVMLSSLIESKQSNPSKGSPEVVLLPTSDLEEIRWLPWLELLLMEVLRRGVDLRVVLKFTLLSQLLNSIPLCRRLLL